MASRASLIAAGLQAAVRLAQR